MRALGRILTVTSLLLTGCQAKTPTPRVARGGGPSRLAGLWEETLTRDGVAPPVVGRTRVCLAASTASELSPLAIGLRRRACARSASRRAADGAELFTVHCDLGQGGASEISGRLARLSPTEFQLGEESVTSGAAMPQLNGRHVVEVHGRWLGACPAGMAPGEASLAGGFRVNLSRAAAAIAAMTGGK